MEECWVGWRASAPWRFPASARSSQPDPLWVCWRAPALLFCSLICGLALVLPAGVLIYWCTESVSGSPDWGETFSVLMGCGGMQMGQVVGRTRPPRGRGGDPPITPHQLAATG